jgi:hypothetical protein
LQWLAARPRIEVSLLTQYIAPAHAKGALAASLGEDDVARAQALAKELNLPLVN